MRQVSDVLFCGFCSETLSDETAPNEEARIWAKLQTLSDEVNMRSFVEGELLPAHYATAENCIRALIHRQQMTFSQLAAQFKLKHLSIWLYAEKVRPNYVAKDPASRNEVPFAIAVFLGTCNEMDAFLLNCGISHDENDARLKEAGFEE